MKRIILTVSALLLPLISLSRAQQTVTVRQLKLFPEKYAGQTVSLNFNMKCVIERNYEHFTFEGVGDGSEVVMLLKNIVKSQEGIAFITSSDLAGQFAVR